MQIVGSECWYHAVAYNYADTCARADDAGIARCG